MRFDRNFLKLLLESHSQIVSCPSYPLFLQTAFDSQSRWQAVALGRPDQEQAAHGQPERALGGRLRHLTQRERRSRRRIRQLLRILQVNTPTFLKKKFNFLLTPPNCTRDCE